MLPIFAVVAGKSLLDIVARIFLLGGTISVIKMAHDKGEDTGYNRGMEYRTQEILLLKRLVHKFQMTREALKDRLHALTAPFEQIDICDPWFFSKTIAVLEKHLPNWRDKVRKGVKYGKRRRFN